MPELLPCPFCGGKPRAEKAEIGAGIGFEISCTNCRASMIYLYSEDAVSNWNCRKNPDGKCEHGNRVFCNTCVANHMIRNIPDECFSRTRNMVFTKKHHKENDDV